MEYRRGKKEEEEKRERRESVSKESQLGIASDFKNIN